MLCRLRQLVRRATKWQVCWKVWYFCAKFGIIFGVESFNLNNLAKGAKKV